MGFVDFYILKVGIFFIQCCRAILSDVRRRHYSCLIVFMAYCICGLLYLWLIVFVAYCIYGLLYLWLIVFMAYCIYGLLYLWLIVFMAYGIYGLLYLWLIVFMAYCICGLLYLWLIVFMSLQEQPPTTNLHRLQPCFISTTLQLLMMQNVCGTTSRCMGGIYLQKQECIFNERFIFFIYK